MGTWPRTVAKPSALNPSSAVSFTFAPASRRIRADSTSPTRAANSRAVNPAAAAPDARVPGRRFAAFTAVRALRSAPLCVSSRTISGCRSDAAHIRRGLLARRFLGVDVGARGHEPFHDVGVAGPGSDHQRRFASLGGRVRVGAGGQQRLDDGSAAVRAGQEQRRDAEIVGGSDVGACTQQPLDQRTVVLMRRPMQGRRAIPLPRVDVDSLRQERVDRLDVPAPDGLDEPLVGCGLKPDGEQTAKRTHEQRRTALTSALCASAS